METVHVIKDAYGCDGDVLSGGWFAGVVVLDDVDREFLSDFGRETIRFSEGKTEADSAAQGPLALAHASPFFVSVRP